MKYDELSATEKEYCDKLTDAERRIYCANHQELSALETHNDAAVRTFATVSRLNNELHRLHGRYNELTDYVFDKPNTTEEEQKIYNALFEVNEDAFSVSITVGNFSAVLNLNCMDECNELYKYLEAVKMNRFDWLQDEFDIAVLIETLVAHEL